MKYNDWISGKKGLFEEISNIKKFTFFNDHTPQKIDNLYQSMYGEKQVPTNLEGLTVPDIAELIVMRFGSSWEKQHTIMTNEIMLGVDEEKQVTGTTTDDTKTTSSTNQTNKTSAFNENSLVTDGENTDSVDSDIKKDGKKDNTTTKRSFDVAQKQLQLFTSSFVVDTVCEDVKKMVSLSIY